MKQLTEIGTILCSIGINTVELAERLKEHIINCPSGMLCTVQLLKEGSDVQKATN